MFSKIYKKSEITFALIWIAIYVSVMNIALQFCNGFDHLETKTIPQLLVPVICIAIIAVISTLFIIKNNLQDQYGLIHTKVNNKTYLYFIPLILMSCINLYAGLSLQAPLPQTLLMMTNLAIGGYVEEIIFRGFLFKAMAKDNINTAILVSAITFGVGHIVNLVNTQDTFGVLLQVCYAIAIGFLYTIIVYKSNSLYPCMISHMFVNGTSVFSSSQTTIYSSLFIIIISLTYAYYLYKKA